MTSRRRSVATALIIVLALLLAALPAVARMGGGMGGGGGGMGGCCGGGMGGGTIDPPAGAAFADPVEMPDQDADPNIVQVSLTPRVAPVRVNGVTANLFTYDGYFPGRTIRVKQGDTLRVHFTNQLPYDGVNFLGFTRGVTNLHTHGMHVSPKEPADYAALSIWPGQSYDYEYDLSSQPPGSFCFYHPHSHGLVAEQYWGGLTGALISADPTTVSLPYETHLMILKDIDLVGSNPAPHNSTMLYMRGMEGSIVMVNGQVNPVLGIRPGQVQRWRILNASTARFYKLGLQGHSLYVIGTDGGLLDKPYAQSYVVLAPGERLDVLVKASTTKGSYKLLSLPYSRMGMMSSAQITLLTMSCQGTSAANALPTVVDASAARMTVSPNAPVTRSFTLSMSMGRGYINGKDFDVDPDMWMSTLGTYEIWEIINQSNMDHPWHQHVNAAQVLSITGGDAAYRTLYTTTPALKDVVIVPKGGRVKLLVPVMDWSGMTMYHCHILEHEDIGMMGMWDIMGDDMGM
jgi:FtsP/CotA-like multicopper oxidase with cupredoxin domain